MMLEASERSSSERISRKTAACERTSSPAADATRLLIALGRVVPLPLLGLASKRSPTTGPSHPGQRHNRLESPDGSFRFRIDANSIGPLPFRQQPLPNELALDNLFTP